MHVTEVAHFNRVIAELCLYKDKGFVIDLETTGLRPFARENPDRMVGIAIGTMEDASHDVYLSYRHQEGPNLPIETLQHVRDLVSGAMLCGHNLSFDLRMLHFEGFVLPPVARDTIIAAHLCNENETSFALKKLAAEYLGKESVTEEGLLNAELKKRKLDKGGICKLPAEMVAPYALMDIGITRRLYHNRLAELERWSLLPLFEEVNAFLLALIRTEIRGIGLDQDEVRRQIATITPKIADYCGRLRELSGNPDINLNSPVQLKNWLKLPSTAHQVLVDELAVNPREDIQTLLDYRALAKAESTYFTPLLEQVDAGSRVHCNFNLHRTVTGRLSSSEPNLQNIPRNQTGRTYDVKKCFVAPPGCFLLEADYSTIEPRIAASLSGDPVMMANFINNHDFHSTIARSMFRKDQISREERTTAKSLGLGVIYGLGAHKAAKKLGLRHPERPDGTYETCYQTVWAFSDANELVECNCSAVSPEFCTFAGRAYIRKFYAAVPELEPYIKAVRSTAARHGYIRIPMSGRCRRFEDNGAAYKSFNSLIQATAAEILRKAFTELDRRYKDRPEAPKLVLSVHDSICAEVQFSEEAEAFCTEIRDVMETTTKLSIPLAVDIKIGYNLSNMGELKL